METKHRRIKALIVVVIVGIGMMQNIHWNFEPGITRSYASFDSVSEEETDKAETGFLSSAVLMVYLLNGCVNFVILVFSQVQ